MIENALLLDPEAPEPARGSLWVESGRIAPPPTRGAPPRDVESVDLEGLALAPGFLDLHFHGELIFAAPGDLDAALARTAEMLLASGTTGFLATTVAWEDESLRAWVTQLEKSMTRVEGEGAAVLGLHLEGPWINPDAAGAQPGSGIRDYDGVRDRELLDITREFLKLVTLAPERPGSASLLDELIRRDVVASLGHSLADDARIDASVEHGMTHVTHLFNAMGMTQQREPGIPTQLAGVAGAVLRDPRLSADLICDGVHVHPDKLRIATASMRDRLMLISDRIQPPATAGASFGAGAVSDDGDALRLPDSTLAGSTLSLDRALRNAQALADMTRLGAVAAATLRPARLLGIEHERGSLRVGARADFAILDAEDRVVETWMSGQRVWSATRAG